MNTSEEITAPTPTILPRSMRKASTKCIYFSSEEDLNAVLSTMRKHPRSSLSSIVSQLVKVFVEAERAQTSKPSKKQSASASPIPSVDVAKAPKTLIYL